MDFIEVSAKTVDDAITKACIELGASSDQLDIQVITEGSTGFLGLGFGSKPAVIRAVRKPQEPEEAVQVKMPESTEKAAEKPEEKRSEERKAEERKSEDRKSEDRKPENKKPESKTAGKPENKTENKVESKPENKSENKPENKEGRPAKKSAQTARPQREEKKEYRKEERKETSKPVKKVPEKEEERSIPERTEEEIAAMKKSAETFLKGVFCAMELPVEIKIEYAPKTDSLEIDFAGDDMGILIGKRGQTLDSLQYLTSLVVNKEQEEYVRVKLDTENYRKRRKETLENLARNIAYKVKRTRKPVSLEPMNPYERRIIHSALQSNKYVETYSEGNEPYRHVVVAPKKY